MPRVLRLLGLAFRVPVPPMIALFVGAGLLGEMLSLFALYDRDTSAWSKVSVFASVMILLVIHYTDSPSFSSTYNAFAADTPDPELHELPGTCAHFVIDQSGTIHQLVSLGPSAVTRWA